MAAVRDGTARALAMRMYAWRRDPALFCREALGFTPWESEVMASQGDVLRACAWYQRVSVRSGHKVGKSKTGAALALWEYVCWPGSRTVLTAPSARQIKRVLWREVGSMWRIARARLQSLGITVSGELAVDPATGLIDKVTGSEILGFSTNDPDKFSGVSAWRVTYIVDEASGVAEPIFKAMKGNMAGGARLILFSNPTQPSGTFYDSHNDSSELYRTFHFDSARVAIALVRREIRGPVGLEAEGLAQTSWVRDMLTEFGADSAEFAVRVRGAFPAEGSDGIVPLAVVQQSMGLWNESDVMRHINERLVCGLDVARFGDDESVLIGRRSTHVLAPTSWRNMDSIALADAVAAEVATWTTPGESTFRKRPLIIADEGGPGSGVCDQLAKRHSKELEVMPVNFGSRADDRTKYVNKRTQLWFGIRHFLKNGGKLPRHRDLRTDLTSVRYGYDKENRWQAEPKKDVKKRLGRSPDYGDALGLCVYTPRDSNIGIVNLPWL